ANDLLPAGTRKLQERNFSRLESETKPGEFLNRVHRELRASLKAGVPVTAIAVPYSAARDEKTGKRVWSEHVGHYVVLTRVSDISTERLGFEIVYLDPMNGSAHNAFFFEETANSFWAREEFTGGSKWIHPKVEGVQGTVSSPYLAVAAPDLNLRPRGLEESQRFVVTLVRAIGDFAQNSAQP
ncbi:MAG: hypothetical protein ABL958_00930, partial [Bdellovibrionia bacterium]